MRSTSRLSLHRGQPEAWEKVEVGDRACWLLGDALCLFVGPTLVSMFNRLRCSRKFLFCALLSENDAKLSIHHRVEDASSPR